MGGNTTRRGPSTENLCLPSDGAMLNHKWGVNAKHALYRDDGRWYHVLEKFPGALFDSHGYVFFKPKAIF